MDIVITLPKNLWASICSGDKEYECRKRIPRNFMRDYDKCWVVLKGTKDVVGFIVIDQFETGVDVEDIADNYLDKLCIDKAWFDEYAKHYDVLSLWKIGRVVYELAIPRDREKLLGIISNPQSYCYCRPTYDDNIRFFKRGMALKED